MKNIKVLPLVVIGTVVGVVISVILILTVTLPDAASAQARNIDNLYLFFLAFSGIIFGIVVLVMLVAVHRFRANPGDHRDGSNVHGITWLEIVWTAIPFVIVLAVAFLSWHVLNADNVSGAAQRNGETIRITGYQFGWKFSYQGHGVQDNPELVVPIEIGRAHV